MKKITLLISITFLAFFCSPSFGTESNEKKTEPTVEVKKERLRLMFLNGGCLTAGATPNGSESPGACLRRPECDRPNHFPLDDYDLDDRLRKLDCQREPQPIKP